jgi:replicative superfamily II helicase
MVGRLEQSLNQMLALGLIQDVGGQIDLTLLGKACGQSALSFNSMRMLIQVINSLPDSASSRDLMAAVQVIPELDRIYLPINKRGNSESGWPQVVSGRFGTLVARALQLAASDMFNYASRSKKALVLDDWISGTPVDQIERGFTTNPFFAVSYGEITSIADSTRFFLGSASQIALILRPSEILTAESLATLMKRLEVGLPEDVLGLLDLGVALDRGEYLLLRNAGLMTVHAVKTASAEQVAEILGQSRADEVSAALI